MTRSDNFIVKFKQMFALQMGDGEPEPEPEPLLLPIIELGVPAG